MSNRRHDTTAEPIELETERERALSRRGALIATAGLIASAATVIPGSASAASSSRRVPTADLDIEWTDTTDDGERAILRASIELAEPESFDDASADVRLSLLCEMPDGSLRVYHREELVATHYNGSLHSRFVVSEQKARLLDAAGVSVSEH